MRKKKNRLTLMHKPSHSLVDMKTETFLVPNSENRAHRSHANTQISKDVFKFSFSPRSICEWNSLPSEIVNSKSLNCFKTNLANYLKYEWDTTRTLYLLILFIYFDILLFISVHTYRGSPILFSKLPVFDFLQKVDVMSIRLYRRNKM